MAQVTSTRIEEVSDEEDVQIHHDLERENLLEQVQSRAKKPSCRKNFCKAIVLSIAGVLFILMMIQLWTDYGSFIQTRTFPPKIYSLGSYCKNLTNTQHTYNQLDCIYELDVLSCKIEKPSKPYAQVTPHGDITWEDERVTIDPHVSTECIELVVWSI
ncbi:MAG: hypothetical protein CMC93_00620 [Flavobacteriaceae bacterium]|nr:hypothetical protein [Flavobacteriaceae bacterium]|tara:strand:- start:4362 stop:4835 length:474 start_codon:yes stop_codon:yes gene_type:complete